MSDQNTAIYQATRPEREVQVKCSYTIKCAVCKEKTKVDCNGGILSVRAASDLYLAGWRFPDGGKCTCPECFAET